MEADTNSRKNLFPGYQPDNSGPMLQSVARQITDVSSRSVWDSHGKGGKARDSTLVDNHRAMPKKYPPSECEKEKRRCTTGVVVGGEGVCVTVLVCESRARDIDKKEKREGRTTVRTP